MVAVLALAGFFALLLVAPILSALVGALSGWVVGLFFGETVLGIFAQLGIGGVEMWQVGLFLGFVGGFFRASFSSSKKD